MEPLPPSASSVIHVLQSASSVQSTLQVSEILHLRDISSDEGFPRIVLMSSDTVSLPSLISRPASKIPLPSPLTSPISAEVRGGAWLELEQEHQGTRLSQFNFSPTLLVHFQTGTRLSQFNFSPTLLVRFQTRFLFQANVRKERKEEFPSKDDPSTTSIRLDSSRRR
ncbi:hypothetical protein O3P69_015269 [Scylla paramamosain]|uniref:Uncharacterized protein n=1 Tax=Scylla paramamosain TaxID=85552 RepID=A0AAW0T3H8_SCYPA